MQYRLGKRNISKICKKRFIRIESGIFIINLNLNLVEFSIQLWFMSTHINNSKIILGVGLNFAPSKRLAVPPTRLLNRRGVVDDDEELAFS